MNSLDENQPSNLPASTLHYEDDPQFFVQFLDRYMKYGSGFYTSVDDDFHKAARQMLDKTIAAAHLPPDAKVLDVGSGWGCLAVRLSEIRPDVDYACVNPSLTQLAYHSGRIKSDFQIGTNPVTFDAFQGDLGSYDAIFFNDSICHLADIGAALDKCHRLLNDSGRLVVQDTFFIDEAMESLHVHNKKTQYVQTETFGFSKIEPATRFLAESDERGFRIELWEDLTDHYLRTIGAWVSNLSKLSDSLFKEQADKNIRYLKFGASSLHYVTQQAFTVLRPKVQKERSNRQLRHNLNIILK